MTESIIRKINRSSLALLQTLDLNERYKAAVEEATRLTGAQHGTILIRKNGGFNSVYSTVPRTHRITPRKNGDTYKTYMSSTIHVVEPSTLKKAHKSLYNKGVRAMILIPLSVRDEKIGVLALHSNEPKHYTSLEFQLLTLYGTLVTLALRNAQFFEESQKSIEARDLFISMASHELKTPLTTISVYADTIAKKVNSKQIPSQASVDILRAESRRLKHIMNELLAFEHIASGKLRYKWQDVNIIDVIKKSIINFKSVNPNFRILVENTLPRGSQMIQGDPEKLQQAFSNILNNSAKFSASHIPIILKLEIYKNRMHISFTDFGKGIKKKDQEKIFSEFYKGQGNTKEGIGLGLYLARRITEKHKGKIELVSKVNKGTNVIIILPLRLYE